MLIFSNLKRFYSDKDYGKAFESSISPAPRYYKLYGLIVIVDRNFELRLIQ